jgi:phage gp46-like protein
MLDFLIQKNSAGIYDLVIENEIIKETNSLQTAIAMSIFMEKRASEDESLLPEYRRGWWGNLNNDIDDYEIGSKFWLLEQARAGRETNALAKKYIADGLQWLKDDGLVKDLFVNVESDNEGTITLTIQYDEQPVMTVPLFEAE